MRGRPAGSRALPCQHGCDTRSVNTPFVMLRYGLCFLAECVHTLWSVAIPRRWIYVQYMPNAQRRARLPSRQALNIMILCSQLQR